VEKLLFWFDEFNSSNSGKTTLCGGEIGFVLIGSLLLGWM
jgi:hypothetical protein